MAPETQKLLDKTGRRILRELRDNARLPTSEIGRPITAFVFLEEAAGTDARVIRVAESSPGVAECHTGAEGFLIRASVAPEDDLEDPIERPVPFGRPRTALVLSSPIPARLTDAP